MEDKVICNKSDLVNAADAIRSKLGVTDTYYVSELSSAIQSIETGGIVPSGTISITENGTVDVTQYASAEVNVSSTPSLQSKSVTYTANGTATITPDAGYDGLSSVDVTVDVASVSTVTINCEANDSFAFWLSPNGVFHNINLKAGANTITVVQYSPIGVYNGYGYTLNNLNNIVNSGSTMQITIASSGAIGNFHIYYATAVTASATQPTD